MRQTLSLFLMTLLAAAPAVAFQTPQATAPTTPLRIGGQTKAPERIHYVAPAYPEAAMAARVSGIVIVEATISKEGNVTDARVLRSIAGLDQAALTAVKQWKYLPTTVDGKPVPVVMTVSVNFTPPGAEAPTPAPMPPPAPPSVRTPQAPTPPPAPDAPKPPAVDPRFDTSDVNLKLTIKVTDKSSGGEQIKTVSLIAANRNRRVPQRRRSDDRHAISRPHEGFALGDGGSDGAGDAVAITEDRVLRVPGGRTSPRSGHSRRADWTSAPRP